MGKDLEILKCFNCGQEYHLEDHRQKVGMTCSGCGMEIVPLVDEKTHRGDTKGLYVLLGFFAIVALLGALGAIMLVHGWNFWVTFALVGGIVYLVGRIFIGKYKISEIVELLSGEMFSADSSVKCETGFDRMVVSAINELPQNLKGRLSNIAIVVEARPSSDVLNKLKLMPNTSLLGLFEGVPINKRSVWQSVTMPERITIFQKNIEAICNSEEEIKRRIKKVIRHEVAHLVGFTEEEIRELGY
jgi:predicted Zn-dependent protease with MMP-like domain